MEDASHQVLDEEECWAFLSAEQMGRLAFRLADEIHVVPVNYAVDSHTLLFRTAPGEKLLASAMENAVAFEVDRIEQTRATSVVVRGRAHILDEGDAHRADQLRAWVGDFKYDVVEIAPSHVSGRSYRLERSRGGALDQA